MAEYLLRHHLGPRTVWRIHSAGLAAGNGQAASAEAIEVLRELNIDLTPHRSHYLTHAMIDTANLIMVMTKNHALDIKRRFPGVGQRVSLLASFKSTARGEDINDPIGGDLETYRRIRDEIDEALLDLILHLKKTTTGPS